MFNHIYNFGSIKKIMVVQEEVIISLPFPMLSEYLFNVLYRGMRKEYQV